VPALAGFALLFHRIVVFEMRIQAQITGTPDADRSRLGMAAVVTAFVAVHRHGGPSSGRARRAGRCRGTALRRGCWSSPWTTLLIALLLGYRVSAFRYGAARDAARSALTYAIVIAVAAGAARAIDLPRLVGPAVLTLVFYLWDAFHGAAPARRRDPRFLWETILLVALALVVVAWNLRLRS